MTTTLILGGARSGKSSYAEKLALESGKEVVYIATARAGDGEMALRIETHRSSRPTDWTTIEEPLLLGDAILRCSEPDTLVLVDCLTLWLTNLIFSVDQDFPEVGAIDLPDIFYEQCDALLAALPQAPGDVIMVSNEVGLGIVPYGAVSRCFTDEAGRLNQAVAKVCDRALFIVAGMPLTLKGQAC